MGKTQVAMYSAKDNETLVTIKIQGSKFLIGQSEPITVTVKVNTTWLSLLNDQLRLKVPVDQGIYMCNPNHPRNTKVGPKWRTELNEQVRHYVNNYSRTMDTYAVCIRHPEIAAFMKGRQNAKPARAPKLKRLEKSAVPKTTLMPPPPPPPLFPGRSRRLSHAAVPSTSRGIRMVSVDSDDYGIPTAEESSVVSWMPKIGSARSLDLDEGDSTAGWDDEEVMEVDGGLRRFDDQLSIVTSASQEVEELRRSGIRVEEIRSAAARQLDKYGNTTLLRMRNEVQQLIRGGLWMKIVSRAPLNSYFLLELLGIMTN